VDSFGKSKLPSGVSLGVMPCPMKCYDEIVIGITGFIQHWQEKGDADVT
jgi:hypothetical protein